MYCLEGANIERWLEFALGKEVEIIDIQMRYLGNARRVHYSLQFSNLIEAKGGQPLRGLKCLKELSLSAVQVDDGEVELLLSNFPLLERLSIAFSDLLRNLSIIGHSAFKLKHLDISYASNIESIEIGNMINLVSLRFYVLRSTPVIQLTNVPKLTEFNISEHKNKNIFEILPEMPSCIRDQLRLLKLSACDSILRWYSMKMKTSELPELINIKQLDLEFRMNDNTYELFSLIEACPLLEKLNVKFLWSRFNAKFKRRDIFVRRPKKKLSPNLRKLELSGYLGSPSELELALFIMNNAVALKELIIEPCNETENIRRRATGFARQHFLPITPTSVNLVIIQQAKQIC